MNRCALVHVALTALLAVPLAAAEPAWTQWRGPGRDGFVAAGDWPDGLAPERLGKRWRVELGPSYSGPVLAGDLVIVTETRDKKTEHVRALDETGDLRLIRATPDSFDLVGEAKVADKESWAYLAVEGRELYVPDLEGLTAYEWK